MHRPSWLRRSKKSEAKAAAITSLASSVSKLVITPRPGSSNASSVPQNNAQSRGSLWDKAYEALQTERKDLVDAFEKLLLSEPETGSTLTLLDGDPSKRERQMSALVAKKLETMKQEQWKLRIGGKSTEVRQQVERIVRVVLVGKDFISSAASMDPIHAGLPWAGVCMLLPLITKDSEQRKAATDGLQYIADLIRRYTLIEQIYLGDEDFPLKLKAELESSVTELYRHVLEYEARAACQFDRNTASQWARNVVEADSWTTIIETIKGLDEACDKWARAIADKGQQVRTARLESCLQRQNHEIRELFRISHEQHEEQGKLQLAELKAGRQEQKAGRQEQKDWHRNAEESACYECLRTTDYESNKNKNPDRIPGTCEWFLRHPKYKKWLEKQGSTWLWVTADPGCGKSVLSRFLIEEYKKGPSDADTICYYFFKDDSEEGRSATHALCAILHQLFSQNNTLLRHAIPEYRRNGNKLPQLFNELWSIFISAAADPDAGSIVCVVDALDECAETSRLPLIRALAKYYQHPGVATRLKFIIVSRPYASIGDAFWERNQNLASVQLMGEGEAETEDIRVEIDLVVQEKVNRFHGLRRRRGVDDDAHIAVQEQLNSVENRTYLWVSLIFPELEKNAGVGKSKLLQLIKNIPKSVDEAYERILNQISDREQARRLLHIVVAAKRPLNLTEMNIALSMKEGATSMEDLDLEPESSFQTTVRELCGLFVAIRDSTVYLIHQTAKEFLVAKNTTSVLTSIASSLDSWRHSLQPVQSNDVLATICITYLSFDVSESGPSVLDEGRWYQSGVEKWLSKGLVFNAYFDKHPFLHPFLEYAAKNWSLHLREAKSLEDAVTLKAALTICASQSNRLRTWFPMHWTSRRHTYPSRPTPKYVTALMVGSYHGLEEVVTTCLAQGAETNLKDPWLGWTALIFATDAGHEDIVEVLLEKGAEVNAQTKDGDTALMIATSRKYGAIVRTLLRHHADPNTQYGIGRTALSNAAVMRGADPIIDSEYGQTALLEAVALDNAEIVKILLESNADPNIHSGFVPTALVRAAANDNAEIVKKLLESSADPDIHSKYGQTALMEAADNGNATIVRMLLDSNADPNIQKYGNGFTALMKAVCSDNAEIVEMLLENRANPMIQTNEGETAITVAKEEKANVDMLLRKVGDAELRSELLAMAERLQAIIDMLHVHEREPAAISNNNNDGSNTSASSSTPDSNRSEEVQERGPEPNGPRKRRLRWQPTGFDLDKIGREASQRRRN